MRTTKRNAKVFGTILTGALVVGGGAALAKSSAGNPPAPKEAKEMDCLVGSWKGTGRITMGPDSAAVKLTWDCKRTSGGWGIGCQLRMTGVPGMDSYEETDLFGYDAGTGKYHWYSVTNAGEVHDHVAAVPKGNIVEWVHDGTQDGKPLREAIRMTFADDARTLHVRAETFLDGKSISLLEGTARK